MPDLPATSCRNVSSLQKWQSLNHIRGCLTGFLQVSKLGRLLRGPTGYLSASGPRSRSSESQSQIGKAGKRNSAREARMLEADIVIDLRRILDAKQEPFVLQDVIWAKRHPVRTQSSRELKFNIVDVVSSSGKSQSTERTSSNDERNPSNVRFEESVSSALVKCGKFPAESIVQLPSNQTAPYVQEKWSSPRKVPVASKSPNKKALLMEAAARILDGSNCQTSRRSSTTARSLRREVDRFKQGQGCRSTSKKASIARTAMVDKSANEAKCSSQSMVILKEKVAESNSCVQSDTYGVFSFENLSDQDSPNSINGELQVTGEEVVRTMQCRMHPLDGVPGGNEQLMELTTAGPNTSQPPIHLQKPEIPVSNVIELRHEASNAMANVSIEGVYSHVDLGQSEDQTRQGHEPRTVSENIGKHHKQCNEDFSADMTSDLGLTLNKEQSNRKFVCKVPRQDFLCLSEPADCSPTELIEDFDEISWSVKTPTDDAEHSDDATTSGCIVTRIESVDDADHELPDIYSNGSIKLSKGTGEKHYFCEESRSDMADAKEKYTTPMLLLCNYNWWTQDNIQVSSAGLQEETFCTSVGCDSPTASTNTCSVVKKVEEGEGVNDENFEDTYTSSDLFPVDKCQQSSPVSVLDAVYDDNPSLGTPFDYLDEARQKLSESLKRYEMLMHMDLDALIKINEENLCNELEEDSDSRSCTENEGYDICDEDHSTDVTDSPDQQSSKYAAKEGDGLGWDSACGYDVINDDLRTRSADECLADKNASSAANLTVDARAARVIAERESWRCKALLDRSSKRSNLRVLEGLRCPWRSRTCCFNSTSEEVEHQRGSAFINGILQMDLTINWSTFTEEMKVMEMELENSLLGALIQEFLSDTWVQPFFVCQVSS